MSAFNGRVSHAPHRLEEVIHSFNTGAGSDSQFEINFMYLFTIFWGKQRILEENFFVKNINKYYDYPIPLEMQHWNSLVERPNHG